MESDRCRWNRRYESDESLSGKNPSPFLVREIEPVKRLVPGIRALDIACGEGRNSMFLARHGFRVTGMDISDAGLDKAVRRSRAEGVVIDFQQVDLEGYRFTESCDLIINFNFLLRDLFPKAAAVLSPGGVMIIDTIMASPQMCAAHNPAYLLEPGELWRICEKLDGEILVYEELPDGEMPTARVLFRKSCTGGPL